MLENAQIVLVGPLTELSGNLHTMSRVAASCNRLLGAGPRQRRNHHNKSDNDDVDDDDEEAIRNSFGVATGLISPQTVLCRHDTPHQVKVIDSCDPPSCENEEGCHDDTENDGTNREQVQLCVLLHALRAGKVVFPELFSHVDDDSDDTMTAGHARAAPEVPSSSTSCSSSSSSLPVTMRMGERSQRNEGSCGRCWRCRARNATRFALVFGGTDVNEFAKEETVRRQMRRVVERMDVVVCFSEVFAEDVAQVWPEVRFRHSPTPPACHNSLARVDKNNRNHNQKSQGPMVHIIRQGVQRPFSSSPSVSHTLSNILSHLVAQSDGDKTKEPGSMDPLPTRVVLWCGGLRHVKDPLFALQASQSPDWPPSVVLVLVGPILDTACAAELFSSFSSSPEHHENESSTERATTKCRITKNGACLWHDGVPHDTIVSFLEDPRVCAVINTSLSEGQSQSLLLAMAHRVPVIGRRIRTNVDLLLLEPHTDDDNEASHLPHHHRVPPSRNDPPPPPSLRATTQGEERGIPHQRAEEQRTERQPPPPPPRGWLVDHPIELATTVAYLVREESAQERNQRVERASLFVQRFHTIEGEQLLYQQMVENLIAY